MKLGSLLGDVEDLSRRKNSCGHCVPFHVGTLAAKTTRQRATPIAFIQRFGPAVQRRWVGPDEVRNETLDAFHLKQLRSLIGIQWPQRIRNVKLN